VADNADAFPHDSTEWADNDHDGTGNNADPDDDNDGLLDVDDPAPFTADADGDGLLDGKDVEHIQALLASVPNSSYGPGAAGHRQAMSVKLDQVESLIASGKKADKASAISKLRDLQGRVDGCRGGIMADKDDWIIECGAQAHVYRLLQGLIDNLS
jgi:hypothetical protein